MPDTLDLVFADGTKYRIEVETGRGDATVEQLQSREGDFARGWVFVESARKWLNLATLVSIRLRRDDPGPFFG